MIRLFSALLVWLTTLSANAQLIYKEYEVDSIARPIGGLPMLEKFVNANRRMPYAAEVSRTTGGVILSAVIEPNGTVSDVTVLRSLRTDCDREAVRVLRLFNAWKPALKGGQPVRQQLTYTVRFTPGGWDCKPDRVIRYFNKNGDLTANPRKIKYALHLPVDSLGYPNNDPVVYRKSGKNWKEFEQLQLRKEPFTYYTGDDPTRPDSVDAYRLRIVDKRGATQDIKYTLLSDGTLLAMEPYSDGARVQSSRYYDRNGMVQYLEERIEGRRFQEWHWYPNGLLHHVALRDFAVVNAPTTHLINQWDSTGTPTVVNGTGIAAEESRRDGNVFLESGPLKAGQKQGEWTGRFKNGPLVYRETYENGRFISGNFYEANGTVIPYDKPDCPPEFVGGMTALGTFLMSHLRYPPEAAQAGVQGKVVVGFVVDAEGQVDEPKVLKGIGHGADEEAVRAVKATSGNWKPGMQRGRKVKARYVIPIFFTGQKTLFLVD